MTHEERIIGREEEQKILKEVLTSSEAEFLAIYGRRRVGKTHLIREYFSDKGIYLELTGQKDGKLHDQLENFIQKFSEKFYKGLQLKAPNSWKEAFKMINGEIEKIPKSKKFILFLDELPWLASKKSNLMQSLDYFWNSYWSKYKNLIVIACGSAASWMIDKLINAKGGLYNRLTKIILLRPYNLKETLGFLRSKGITLSQHQVLDLYMAFGGIPHYLKQARKGKSVTQIINESCFQSQGLLYQEFDRLFESLFESPKVHEALVRAIASQQNGISRKRLIEVTGIPSGGRLNQWLAELEASNFTQSYVPLGRKKKDHYYRVIDEYTYFYLKWIEPLKKSGHDGGKNYWKTQIKTPKVLSWKGYAFENVCFKHLDQIRASLDLDSIHSQVGSWRFLPERGKEESGAQIDLIFDREDGVVTLCEMKYSDKIFIMDKSFSRSLAKKMNIFEMHYPTNKQIFFCIITTRGAKQTVWSEEIIQNEISLEDIFRS